MDDFVDLSDNCLLERHRECFKGSRRCGCDCHLAKKEEAEQRIAAGTFPTREPVKIKYVDTTPKERKPRPSRAATHVEKRPPQRNRGVQLPDSTIESIERDLAKGLDMRAAAQKNGATYEQVRSIKRTLGKIVPVDYDRELSKLWRLRHMVTTHAVQRALEGDPEGARTAMDQDRELGVLHEEFTQGRTSGET